MKPISSKAFSNNFTSGRILPALITFAIPLFLSNLLQAVYNVVDMIVVGHVVGEAGLSGLSVGGDVLSFLTFVSMGFSNASQVIIAQYTGAGLRKKLARFIGAMTSFLLLCAVGMSVLCLFFREQILTLLNTPAEAWEQALSYATVCTFGLVFIYGYNIVSAIMRGMGDSKRPLMFIAIATIVNLVLDILFVAVFRWEAFGAALATVIAQAVSFVTAVIYLYRNRARFNLELSPRLFLHFDWKELSILVKLGVPFAIRSASVLSSKLFVNAWINSYGVTISAVTGVGYKVDTIANLMSTAVSTAGSSMVGQNIGAEKYDRASRVLGCTFILNGLCFSLMFSIVALFPRAVYGIFTSDAAVLLVCLEYLPISLTNFVCSVLRSSMNSFTGGCGNYKFNFAVAIVDGIVARIGLSLLLGLALDMGYFGFWLGNALAGVTPFVLGMIYYLSGWWRKPSRIIADKE